MSTTPAQDFFTVDFKQGSRTPRPLPPPGYPYDGAASEDASALFPVEPQVTTITLGTTTATGDITTLTVTPVKTAQGSAWPQSLVPFVFTFVTGATETLAAVAAGLEAAAAAAATVVSLADIANYQRVSDFITVTSSGDDIIVTTRDAGATFTAVLVTDGNITSAQVTTGDDSDELLVGTIGVQGTVNADGSREIGISGSAGDVVLGVVMYSIRVKPRVGGELFDVLERGNDVVYLPWGRATAFAEKAVAVDADVFRRHAVTNAGDILGAVSDTNSADHTQLAGWKFLQTTTAAGTAPVDVPHP